MLQQCLLNEHSEDLENSSLNPGRDPGRMLASELEGGGESLPHHVFRSWSGLIETGYRSPRFQKEVLWDHTGANQALAPDTESLGGAQRFPRTEA